jgi:hypothetical protein
MDAPPTPARTRYLDLIAQADALNRRANVAHYATPGLRKRWRDQADALVRQADGEHRPVPDAYYYRPESGRRDDDVLGAVGA